MAEESKSSIKYEDNEQSDHLCEDGYLDECDTQEVIVNDKDLRVAATESPDKNESIMQCIGHLKSDFIFDKYQYRKSLAGTATVFHVAPNGDTFAVSCAHNVRTLVWECDQCHKYMDDTKEHVLCDNANQLHKKVIKANRINFVKRSIHKRYEKIVDGDDKKKEIIQYGDTENVYECDTENVLLNEKMYEKFPTGSSGYDFCVIQFKSKSMDYAELVKNIRIKHGKETIDTMNCFNIWGFPGDKLKIVDDKQEQKGLFGMKSHTNGKYWFRTHKKTKKIYLKQNTVDAYAGQSGSSIWVKQKEHFESKTQYIIAICGIHTGGNARDENNKFNVGVLFDDNILKQVDNFINNKPVSFARKVIDVEGRKNDKLITHSFRLPSDDWSTNLDFLNKKICKKFGINGTYGLEINGVVFSSNNSQMFITQMRKMNFENKAAIKIIYPFNDDQFIVVHWNNNKYTFEVNKDKNELDDVMYDTLLSSAKTHFGLDDCDVMLYENVNGRHVDMDDWYDLRLALEDQKHDETMHLCLKVTDDDSKIEKKEEKEKIEDRIIYDPGFHQIKCQRLLYKGVDRSKYTKLISTQINKVIMVVGQTGAGKTTFVNSLVNYIYNVQFEDKFRLKLIREKDKQGGQAVSQTDDICAYTIKKPPGSNLHYDLTIIDTPGFGDTRGIDRDKKLVTNIKSFFENVLDSIDAICFVVKATDTRLSASQKYIFNSVLNLWGKDVKENIFILMTFADAEDPQVLDAIKQEGTIADCEYFKLNNSVYKKDPRKMKINNQQSMIFDKMFWDMGTICFNALFKGLNAVASKSLTVSKEVLRKRDEITSRIDIMQSEVFKLLEEQQEIKKQQAWISKHKQNNQFAKLDYYEKKRYYFKKRVFSDRVTTCKKCPHRTCCALCDTKDNSKCDAMNKNGKCRVCGCSFKEHDNQNYYWISKTKKVLKTDWNGDIQKKHGVAMEKKINRAEIILKKLNEKYEKDTLLVRKLMGAIHNCICELEQIALRPVTTTVEDYIDTLIETEDDAKTIKQLKQYKTKENIAKIMQEKRGEEECWKLINSVFIAHHHIISSIINISAKQQHFK
eukprot:207459_1